MAIQFHCTACGAKLKLKDELAGRAGKCPTCKGRIEIPAAATAPPLKPTVDQSTSSINTTHETKLVPPEDAAYQHTLADDMVADAINAAPTLPTISGDTSSIPFDSLDDEPLPSIVHLGAAPTIKQTVAITPKPVSDAPFSTENVPKSLGLVNHYLIVDHKDVVARWENDGRGWMIHLKDGFCRASTVQNQIPTLGSFVLVEVGVERRSDGLHLKNITPYLLQRQYALTKIAKGDDAILEAVIGYAELNDRQKNHVRELIKKTFLPRIWPEMDSLLP